MLEFLPIKIESTLDWSLIIAIIAVASYYFGKLITEVRPKKENKFAIYTEGVVFIVLFVLFPTIALYPAGFQKLDTSLALGVMLIFAIQGSLTYGFGKAVDEFNNQIKADEVNKMPYSGSLFYVLFVFFMTEYGLTQLIITEGNSLYYSLASIFFLFLALTEAATLYGLRTAKDYPEVTIHLNNGDKLSGGMVKIEESSVSLVHVNKKYCIRNDNILYIEEKIKK